MIPYVVVNETPRPSMTVTWMCIDCFNGIKQQGPCRMPAGLQLVPHDIQQALGNTQTTCLRTIVGRPLMCFAIARTAYIFHMYDIQACTINSTVCLA